MAGDAAKKVSALLFRRMDKMRHRGAFDVGAVVPEGKDFTGFGKTRQILLVTFKRSGEGMPTPINTVSPLERSTFARTPLPGSLSACATIPVSWWCQALCAESPKDKR
jgi:hypothetical protein